MSKLKLISEVEFRAFRSKDSNNYRKLDSLDNLDVASEDDRNRDNEAEDIDEEDVGNVLYGVLPGTVPLDTTAATSSR